MGLSESYSEIAVTGLRVPTSSSSSSGIGTEEQYALSLPRGEITETAGLTDWLPDFLKGRATEGKCAPSPLYEHALDMARRLHHDQKSAEKLQGFKAKFNCDIKTDDDAVNYANEALQVFGDPYTKVLNKRQADELKGAIDGDTEVSGIGIHIGMQKNERTGGASYPIVGGVFPGTPAERAGLKRGDIIMQVGDQSTRELPLQQVQLMVRGEAGSKAQLKVDRDGQWLDVFVTREKIEVPAIVQQSFDDVHYVRLIDFMNDKTDTSLKTAILEHPKARAFIIDLRGNPGGRVDEMVQTVGLLIKEGKLYTEDTRTVLGPATQTLELDDNRVKAIRPGTFFDVSAERNRYLLNGRPLVVLVDEYSASASELLAGAVKDNRAGLLVGEKTFGKGVGQAVVPIDNGTMVAVTNTKFTNPGGGWAGDGNATRLGIEPNIRVPQENRTLFLSGNDKQFQRALAEARRIVAGGAMFEIRSQALQPASGQDRIPGQNRPPVGLRFQDFSPPVRLFKPLGEQLQQLPTPHPPEPTVRKPYGNF